MKHGQEETEEDYLEEIAWEFGDKNDGLNKTTNKQNNKKRNDIIMKKNEHRKWIMSGC